jgi:hypothetical protein
VRKRARDTLWKISDRLCSHRLTFEAGHWIGELGWRLRKAGTRLSEDGDHA